MSAGPNTMMSQSDSDSSYVQVYLPVSYVPVSFDYSTMDASTPQQWMPVLNNGCQYATMDASTQEWMSEWYEQVDENQFTEVGQPVDENQFTEVGQPYDENQFTFNPNGPDLERKYFMAKKAKLHLQRRVKALSAQIEQMKAQLEMQQAIIVQMQTQLWATMSGHERRQARGLWYGSRGQHTRRLSQETTHESESSSM